MSSSNMNVATQTAMSVHHFLSIAPPLLTISLTDDQPRGYSLAVTIGSEVTIQGGPPRAAPPRCLSRRIGFLLARGHIDCLAMAGEVLEPGLTGKHFGCMATIVDEGPLSQQTLGDRLRVDRTTIVAVVDELERRGFVARPRNPADRRAYALEATAEGRRWVRRTSAALADAEARLLDGLEPDEREELIRLLQKLIYGAPVDAA
jgi:DNA-binding MarR family transcriptional regulator